jgi:hypothetical protein
MEKLKELQCKGMQKMYVYKRAGMVPWKFPGTHVNTLASKECTC